ncbi:hypothetical protein GvMRE_IIg282 [endosymbiont GvMRE of Glomus versiforme]|nr:hypothetical protein GvMRE_IIg282 [endosymbiont GvMRE of Glomus versiforme]
MNKLLLYLFKNFKWKISVFFSFQFLVDYVLFLIRFNLINNLSYYTKNQNRGNFSFLFGRFCLSKSEGNEILIDWNKLLFLLFLLYFPIKLVVHLTLNYWKKKCQREINVYLIKKLINYAYKNDKIINIVTEFSYKFISILASLFEIVTGVFFVMVNLQSLIRSCYLLNLVIFLVSFVLANIAWLISFYFFLTLFIKLI